MKYPKKIDNLYVERLDGELCVYDWERKMVHALNPTAASVLEMCDGQTSVAQMATRLEQELNVPQAEKVAWLSLAELEQADLLTEKVVDSRTLSRREMLKTMGVAVALLPVVTSIVAPTPAQAQTCVSNCYFFEILEFSEIEFNSCQEYGEWIFEDAPPGYLLCSVESEEIDDLTQCRFNYYDPYGCEDNGENAGADSLRRR